MAEAFVELHARSAFSFLRGSSQPEELVKRAADLDMARLAVLDRDGVYGTARVHHEAREQGLRGLVGAELTMEDKTVLPVLVRTREGYRNLCRLLTRSKLSAPKGAACVTWNALECYAEGLLALTGDEEGPLAAAMNSGDAQMPAQVLDRLKCLFGRENVVAEVQRHLLREDAWRSRQTAALAADQGLLLVASNGVCHARREGRLLLDAFTALRHRTTLDEAGLILAPNSQRHLKNAREMRALFPDMPQAVENTLRVADRLEFTLEDLGYEFPRYSPPSGHDEASYLREMAYAGARERFRQVTPAVTQQMEHELRIIGKLGFSGYFLVVWDIVRFCQEQGILVQGRGSAANSVVCYSLGITNADPIAGKLLFERFLSEGRNTWPDIDLDLPSGEGRERVIQEVYRRFAPYGAAMTANVITYRGRSAMREMTKVLGLPHDVGARFSDLFASGDFPHTMELKEQLKKADMEGGHPRLPALVKLYHAVRGMPRHLGQHSGGMVLCTAGLDSIVPLEPASMPGRVVVQWDKDDCEDLGIIKVDLLGLGMMAVLKETMNLCAERGPQRAIELHCIPHDDPETYAMLQRADTVGVFQVESRAQMSTLPRMKPRTFYDLVIEVAIIRPGPIVGKLVHPYLNRRAGREPVDYIHDSFKPVLERTLGVPLFQEQILQMAMAVAGFNGSEAEELRRAMSCHRSPERMARVTDKLRAAMTERGVSQTVQERIVGSIRSFALYGFPESHAISFALLAYASAWLRTHRLAEFTAALLNNQPMGFYSPSTLVRDARQHGLRVRPVCITASEIRCTVEDDSTIRLGLNQVRGLSQSSMRRIIGVRDARPWADMNDFLLRCPLPRDERRILARAGVLNVLTQHRRAALWEVEQERQVDLFTGMREHSQEAMPLAMMTPVERLEADYASTALTVGPHPMGLVRSRIPDSVTAAELIKLAHGEVVDIAGMVICRQRPGTAKGHVFISLEDETGIANVFVPSALFETSRLVITQEKFLHFRGRVQNVDNVVSVYALVVNRLPYEVAVRAQSHDFH